MNAYAMPTVGAVIAGKYRLDKVAGEGGMGIVYAAEHLVLRQRVAVKILLADAARSDAVVERFAREAQAAARIQSEHVARVLDAGSLANGAPFLVMEYLEGCDLEELLELQKKLSVTEAVDYAMQACEALAHAHAVGIIHRDLKPANLFLACRADGGTQIKMLDFGISKSMKAAPTEKKLTGHHVLGSPVYMSPEQLRNSKTIDPRADLWSLGIVIYEMLTGTTPFDGEGVGEIFAAILGSECEPLHVRNPKVPRGLSDVVKKCLERDPAARWQDAGEVAAALAPFGSGAWNDVVPRIEQLFTRARMMRAIDTPVETRLVVDAIAAAAERARTTGFRSAPPSGSQPKPTVIDTTSTASEAAAFARPRWQRLLFAVAAMAVIGAIVVFGLVRPTLAGAIGAATVAVEVEEATEAARTTALVSASSSARADAHGPPGATQKPAGSTTSSATTSKKPPAKRAPAKSRPKFLKTRE